VPHMLYSHLALQSPEAKLKVHRLSMGKQENCLV